MMAVFKSQKRNKIAKVVLTTMGPQIIHFPEQVVKPTDQI